MKAVMTVARKELRTLFHSPVALIFLALFELVTLLAFFQASRWFARNIADVRPLFEWLPLLLVFLTAAVTMRQWAEERKVGTLEMLMTLPVPTRDLVLGKFVAATALVAVALSLTLPLPLMVSALGPLDLGPVIGGYVGALLLGALYVSIGLCVSARTDNQVVSLMVTLLIGGALYAIGSPRFTSLFSNQWSEVLQAIGTGSRFESIERGVLDLRDLVYYGGLTSFFLVLNVAYLESDRLDAESARGRATSTMLFGLVTLVAANAVAAVVWLTPVTAARIDMTEGGEYSISPATKQILSELDEPLFIDGYFSENTHPLLKPLVPQIRDTLAEYEIAGGGHVVVEFADPNDDPDLEQEIAEQYSIRSVPFQVDDAHQQSVVNSFFHVLVRYGDQNQVLSFDDLIEFSMDSSGPQVRLKNIEYDLTRAIKRVSQDFSTVASVLADLPEPAKLTAYFTRASLPEQVKELPDLVKKVGDEVAKAGSGKLTIEEVDPSTDPALKETLFSTYGLRPIRLSILDDQTFYLYVLLTMGDKVEMLPLGPDDKEADIRTALEAALKRLAPGQLTTIGVITEQPEAEPPNPQLPPQYQPPPPRPDYQFLQQKLGDSYSVEPVEGADGQIPDTVDVLVVGKPGKLSDELLYGIDQYLMRGGRIIALASTNKIKADRSGLSVEKLDKGFNELLATWGVKVSDAFVVDQQNAPFPRPVQEKRGGFVMQRIELTPYAFFPDIRQDGFERGHPAVAGLVNITTPWASPLEIVPIEGVTPTVIAKTSAESWTYAGTDLDPPAPGTELKSYPVVVVASGTFPSFFADKPDPTAKDGGGEDAGRTLKQSLPDARLAVVGSSEMVSDILLQLAESPGGELHRNNELLLRNLVDWSTEDTDLLGIRSAGAFARTLDPMEEETRSWLEYLQYAVGLLLLLGISFIARTSRNTTRPISTKGIGEVA